VRGCQWNHGIFDLDDKDGEWRDGQTDAARLLGMPRLTFNVAMQELEKLHLVHIDQVLLPLPIVNITVGDDGGLVEQPFAAPEQGNDRATTGREVGNVESDYPEKSMWSTPRLFSPGTPVSPIPYPSDTAPSPAATERTDQPSAEVGGETYEYPYYPVELKKFADVGLLIRRGQRYYISILGRQAYDWCEQQQQREAA
jgi:hypothetical protein